MRDRLFWIPYSKQVAHSNQWFFLYSLLFSLLLIYLVHALIFFSHKSTLDRYADNVFFQAEQLDFQIKHGVAQAQSITSDACTESDLIALRKILDQYYYLGDIGRVQGNQVLCTVKKGLLLAPLTLEGESHLSASGIQYWNNQDQLMFDNAKPPMFTSGNVVASLSSVFLLDIHRGDQVSNGSGGYLYLKNDAYILKLYDKVLEFSDVQKTLNYTPSLYDWTLLPGGMINKNRCEHNSDICLMTVVKPVGITSLPYFYIILIGLCSLALGALAAYLLVLRIETTTFLKRLRKAIRTGKIYSVYQPKVSLRDHAVTGVEALARWQDPILGFVRPDLFIAVAEQTNLIKDLTEQLIKGIFTDLSVLLERNPEFTISINVTASLMADKAFLSFLNAEVAKYKFKNKQIIVEITERTTSNSDEMAEASKLVKAHGYQVSLDDFGTGFSNLSWLTTFEPNEIKIDKMFTQSINTESVNRITLDGMFSMVDHLSVKVVFEGIEEESELAYIKQRVPDAIGQGWLFSKALPVNDFMQYYIRQQGTAS